jgi:hypothetical protein
MVLVYYPIQDHDVAGLSKATKNYLTILVYGLPKYNQSKI